MRLIILLLFLVFPFCNSCDTIFYSVRKDPKLYSVQEDHKLSFIDSCCDNSSVFVSPKFQVYGLDQSVYDSVTLSAISPGSGNHIVYSVTIPVNSSQFNRRSAWDSVNGIVRRAALSDLNQSFRLQDSVTLNFCLCDTLLPLSFDFSIQFGRGRCFRITDIEVRKMHINSGKRGQFICSIYSYRVNGKKYYSKDFVIIMPGTRLDLRPLFYVNRRGLFFSKKYSNANYIDMTGRKAAYWESTGMY